MSNAFLYTGIPDFDKATWEKMEGNNMTERMFDKFIQSLEEVIDCQDDMWEEEKYENHATRRKIFEERFIPARDKLKDALDDYIDERILKALKKHGVRRTYDQNK